MILQAYDFLELNNKENCILQIGGWDQWGNIINGVDLIKKYSDKEAFGLTTPLITLASGAKMGKTADGAVWLDKKFLSPYDYWQFWRNTDDRDVKKFLKFFTDIETEEIKNFSDQNINELKILLANKTTEMLHGKKESLKSEKIAKEAFSDNSSGSSLPSIELSKKILSESINIIDLVVLAKFEQSKSEVRRLIKGKAVKINNQIIEDEKFIISDKIFKDNYVKLSIGKKRHIRIQLS